MSIQIQKRSLLELIFVDDTCICTENEDHLQQSVQFFSEVCQWFGLKVSVEKTEIKLQRAKYGPSPKTPKYVSMDNTLKLALNSNILVQ